MYVPHPFQEVRTEEITRLIQAHPLGALVTHGAGGLSATHLPFEWAPQEGPHGALQAHVARANPVWTDNQDGDEVLVIFKGADAYISPNWYPSKHEFHRQVPTWNYQVVHVHGKLRIRDDEMFLRRVLAKLTRAHEARAGGAKPWKMGDSEPGFIDSLLTEIVGIEIRVERIVGASKLSQNKEARDRAGVVSALREQGCNGVAEATLNAGHRIPEIGK